MFLKFNITHNFTKFYQTEGGGSNTPDLTPSKIADIFNEEDDTVNEDDEIDLNKKDKKKDKDENKDIKSKNDKGAEEGDEEEDKSTDVQKSGKDEDKDDSGDSEDELSEIEDELEDEIEVDEDDFGTEYSRPSRKTILAKFPDLFKDFPGIEQAYFREQKFSEIYPSIKDAQVASEKAKALDNFEKELLQGNTTNVIKAVKEEDENSFNKLVDNYLPSLKQIDEKAYFHVVGTIIKGVIFNMVKDSREENNEELQEAARVLNQFVFKSSKYTPPTKLAKDDDNKANPEAEKLAKERQEFAQQRFQAAHQNISGRVNTLFTKYIEKNIDPKGSMTTYIKNNAMRDAHESLDKLLDKDARFKAVLTKAWEKATEDNYSEESMDRLMKVIKNRAGALLPSVIKKARIEALKGMGKRVRETVDNDDDNDTESGDTTSSQNRGPLKSKERKPINPQAAKDGPKKGQSLRDYIMSD